MKKTAYLLQATLVCAWWIGLSLSQTFFDAFQYEGISPLAFWSFLAPDILMIALLSIIRAYRNVAAIEFMVLGAFGYAALYCINLFVLTRTGLLPTGLMSLGLMYNVLLCLNQSLFHTSPTESVAMNAGKTLIQIVCIWFLTLVVFPYVILESFNALTLLTLGNSFWLGTAIFLGFSVLGLIRTAY